MNLHPAPLSSAHTGQGRYPEIARDEVAAHQPWIPADQPAATICRTEAGYELKEGEIKPTWQMYRVLMGQEKKRISACSPGSGEPSPTILGDTAGTTAGLVHPYEIRKLTIAEVKALASYPEEFQLVGSYRARWARIGNSVPPLL